jgi:hypothetical protein
MRINPVVAILVALMTSPADAGGVVINEIFYNAPDDLDDIQWIELFNPDDRPADLGGWTLDKGKLFTLPPGSRIEPKGFLVVSRNPE